MALLFTYGKWRDGRIWDDALLWSDEVIDLTADNTFVVGAEDRVFVIAPEDRTFVIAGDDMNDFVGESTKTKDPDATVDFPFDWSQWLGSDVIQSVTWDLTSGITKVDEDFSDTIATVWLSGGTAPYSYRVTCRVVTLAGRTDERSAKITVRER